MRTKELKITAGTIIKESDKLSKDAKIQLLNFIREASPEQVKALLLDGKVTKLDEQSKQIVNDRFEASFLSEAGIVGNLVGMIFFTPVAWAAWRVAHALFSSAARKCGVITVSEKRDSCMLKVKIQALNNKIAVLKKVAADCGKSKDAVQCKNSINDKIKKIFSQIQSFQEKLADLERMRG